MQRENLFGIIIIDDNEIYLKQPKENHYEYKVNLLSRIEELCYNYGHDVTIQYSFVCNPAIQDNEQPVEISGHIYANRLKVKYYECQEDDSYIGEVNYETEYEYTLMIEGKDLYEEFKQRQDAYLFLSVVFNY